jgi:hypothetical protein
VVTPHFSYSSNFAVQYRLSPDAWGQLQAESADCAAFLQNDPRLVYVPGLAEGDFAAFVVGPGQADAVATDIAQRFPQSAQLLADSLYDAHAMMAGVLSQLYEAKVLTYGPIGDGTVNALGRTEGACRFCVNEHWTFPLGCPYGKPQEPSPPAGFLRQVAAGMVETKPAVPGGDAAKGKGAT